MDESITVQRVRHALVVGQLDADGAAVLLAANLPPKRDRTYVVVGASALDGMTRLDPWVVADLADEARGDLCVVAPNFGSMGRNGALPPAKLLAERLGVEVTAPDGAPVALADGSLFVPGSTAGWVSYRPDGARIPIGARFPAPWWQDGLPDAADITHVPAGLWVRHPGAPTRPDDRLLRQAPDRDRMYVVLGAPGEPPPAATSVAGVLRALPDEGRDRAVLACYGFGGDRLVREVAGELGAPVRVAHGVPDDDGIVQVDETGEVRWRPFAVESVYRHDGAPVLDRWAAPASLAMVEPGSYRLTDGWRVDVVPRGLAVRPDEAPRPETAAEAGPTADIVFAAEAAVPSGVLAAFNRLVRDLPTDARENLRILPQGDPSALTGIEASDRIAQAPAPAPISAQERVPPPKGAVMVATDGRVLPVAPILAVPGKHDQRKDVRESAGASTEVEPVSSGIPSVAAASVAPAVVPAPPVVPMPSPAQPQRVRQQVRPELPVDPVTRAQPLPPAPVWPASQTGPIPMAQVQQAVSALPSLNPPLWGHPRSAPPNGQPPWISAPTPPAAEPVASTEVTMPGTLPAVAPVHRAPVGESPQAVSTESAGATAVRSVGGTAVRAATAVASEPSPQVSAATKQAATPSPAAAGLPSTVASSAMAAPAKAEPEAKSTVEQPVTGLLPERPRAVEVPEDARSTATQRRAMRATLGSRYDVATRAVTKLLSERPGMRFAAEDRAALLAELAVVRVFADDPTGEYDTDFYVCLADGLRRLPTVRTVVVRGIPADTEVQPEAVLRLPTPVVAAPAAGAGPVGPAEALIWTTSGRRLDGLLDDEPAHRDDVVLSGHTRLRVLAVESAPVPRILLAEDGTAGDAALTRLRAAAAARSEVPARQPDTDRWFGPLPVV
ncbi:hypothetical protein [Saccharopolyspora sp. NPDC002686]|uniref:hypothetical protein n=1 Tax=Saccharopolyspora sp. NPDC002686 TaxID=3154541 RepID=UPI003324A34A